MSNDNREYRNMAFEVKQGGDEPSFLVEGYASTFERYKLIEIDGEDYNEQIQPGAFDDADMTDVVFRVDHEGPVFARASAGTVLLNVDEHGLHQISDLSKTQRGRDLFEDIAAGNYPQMSFAFTVGEEHYDAETRTRVIDRVAKVFDVSPVTWPANPTTELHVRNYFEGVIEEEKRRSERERELEEKRQAIRSIIQGRSHK